MDFDNTRQYHDRRSAAVASINLNRIYGRRRCIRRDDDGAVRERHLDTFPRHYFWVTLLIMTLCAADAFNTIYLLEHGAIELNPLMDILIERDVLAFILCKHILMGLGLVVLVAYSSFNLVGPLKARHVLYMILAVYLCLFVYQMFLMSLVPT